MKKQEKKQGKKRGFNKQSEVVEVEGRSPPTQYSGVQDPGTGILQFEPYMGPPLQPGQRGQVVQPGQPINTEVVLTKKLWGISN